MSGGAPKGRPRPLRQRISSEDFVRDFVSIGPAAMSRKYNVAQKSIFSRRRAIEKQTGSVLTSGLRGGHWQQLNRHPAAVEVSIMEGHILVGSDSHYWPGIVSTAHKAFLEFAREYKPKVIVKNGDELDFPSISRHAPIGWEERPKVADEIENTRAMLTEIQKSSPKSRLIWPLGNHCARFESRLAVVAPEYANVHGIHLKDHFPDWEPCWACFVNGDTVVKHRIKGGVYAPRANTVFSGRNVITGHLHSLKVWPHSDYNGTRFGVDGGTMADVYGPQSQHYTELSPLDWRSGFVLLTFVKGRLLWPETIWVSGPDTVQFRGREWTV